MELKNKVKKSTKTSSKPQKQFFYQKPKLELTEDQPQLMNNFIELETRTMTEPGNLENWIEFILILIETKGLQ